MKRMKRLASLMLAMVLALAMTMTAFAAGTADPANPGGTTQQPEGEDKPDNTPTTDNTTKYELYQIFTGQFYDGKLSDAVWGINGTGYKADAETEVPDEVLTKLVAMTNSADDLKKADVIDDYVNFASAPFRGADAQPTAVNVNGKSGYQYTGLPSGYYLIKNAAENADPNEIYVVQVIGDGEEGDQGTGTLQFVPKVEGVPTPGKTVKDQDEWQSAAAHKIGDEIEYQLSAKLPSPSVMEKYKTYKLVFHDKLSKGLDYVANSVVVKVNGAEIAPDTYTLAYDGPTGDQISDQDRNLTITFNDVKAAPVNAEGNEVITVEYKAKLNKQAVIGQSGNLNELTLEYSNDPDDESSTTTTPPTTAIVFTFKTIVNKVDGEQNPLAGAAFTLAKYVDGTWEDVETFDELEEGATTFNFTGLDEGIYRLTETKTPSGYNTIDPIYFEITAEYTGNDGTKDALKSFVVKAVEQDEEGNWTASTKTDAAVFEATLSTGEATTQVVNQAGSLLPSTGGIGTTIFYVVGGILVVGAGILLVTKKRMSAR